MPVVINEFEFVPAAEPSSEAAARPSETATACSPSAATMPVAANEAARIMRHTVQRMARVRSH